MPWLGSAIVHDDLGASLSAYAPLARLYGFPFIVHHSSKLQVRRDGPYCALRKYRKIIKAKLQYIALWYK